MDRSSLYLQNLEKSSPLEPLYALTRHWNSQQIYTHATTHSRATSTSKLGVPSIISDKDNHHSIDHPPIYLSTVEKPPSEVEHASTRRLKSWGLCPRAVANPNLDPNLERGPHAPRADRTPGFHDSRAPRLHTRLGVFRLEQDTTIRLAIGSVSANAPIGATDTTIRASTPLDLLSAAKIALIRASTRR
uniref:Uncharacterized protein n=1 Tax=Fagus sylvatica TaxID=28930 RepID=A0A2N9I717_FAGSY